MPYCQRMEASSDVWSWCQKVRGRAQRWRRTIRQHDDLSPPPETTRLCPAARWRRTAGIQRHRMIFDQLLNLARR
ncbi:MAG: hypothetical protein ACLUHE_15520 [Christensenellales bacterium]